MGILRLLVSTPRRCRSLRRLPKLRPNPISALTYPCQPPRPVWVGKRVAAVVGLPGFSGLGEVALDRLGRHAEGFGQLALRVAEFGHQGDRLGSAPVVVAGLVGVPTLRGHGWAGQKYQQDRASSGDQPQSGTVSVGAWVSAGISLIAHRFRGSSGGHALRNVRRGGS